MAEIRLISKQKNGMSPIDVLKETYSALKELNKSVTIPFDPYLPALSMPIRTTPNIDSVGIFRDFTYLPIGDNVWRFCLGVQYYSRGDTPYTAAIHGEVVPALSLVPPASLTQKHKIAARESVRSAMAGRHFTKDALISASEKCIKAFDFDLKNSDERILQFKMESTLKRLRLKDGTYARESADVLYRTIINF